MYVYQPVETASEQSAEQNAEQNAEQSAEQSAHGASKKRQTQIKTLIAESLDPKIPQPILADERGRAILCADLRENLILGENPSFELQPSRLVSVLLVLTFLGFSISGLVFFLGK